MLTLTSAVQHVQEETGYPRFNFLNEEGITRVITNG